MSYNLHIGSGSYYFVLLKQLDNAFLLGREIPGGAASCFFDALLFIFSETKSLFFSVNSRRQRKTGPSLAALCP